MNSKLKGIIAGCIAVVCLGGTAVFLKQTEKKDDGASSSSQVQTNSSDSSDTQVLILPGSSENISSVDVKNAENSFTVEKPASGKSTWSIEALSTVNQNTSYLTTLISNCGQLTAEKLVEENADDMAKYGLDKPLTTFTVNYTDGTSQKVLIGSEVPNNERYSYVCLDGEKKIYMVLGSKLSCFSESVNAFVATELIETPANDNYPEYGKETVERKDLDYKMVFENDPYNKEGMVSAQVMTEPIFSYLNVSASTAVTHGMWGLSAQKCAVVHPSDKDMEKYGLADPSCTVTLKGDEYDYVLKIGDPVYSDSNASDSSQADSNSSEAVQTITGYYCYLTGVSGADCIYEISADKLPWLTIDPSDIISGLMTSNYLVDLENIEIKCENKTYSYKIETTGSSDDSDSELKKVSIDGKSLDTDKFKDFYQYVMTCPTTEIYFKEPEGESVAEINLIRKNGGKDTMEFFKDSSRRTIVKLNGKTSFRIQTSWLDTLKKNISNIESGKSIDENY